ncbi:MAG TPA: WhiB family transcriptional regulator [Pseudonocardiaceae bacterium]|nr:WhiB family transcriptional regulator [Pseudonocardiaceae bacterium]
MRVSTGRTDATGRQVWEVTTAAHARPRRTGPDTFVRDAQRTPHRELVTIAARLAELAGPQSEWRARAACRGRSDIEWQGDGRGWEHEAKAVCAGCPVRARCLQDAIENREFGVWGGTTETERDRLRRGEPARSAWKQARADLRTDRMRRTAELREQGQTMPDIARALGIATSTVYDYCRELGLTTSDRTPESEHARQQAVIEIQQGITS